MQVNWREITAAKNTFAALYAACEAEGITLRLSGGPEGDVTCYSLNSINAPHFQDEIASAPCITIVGGPHAAACPAEVARYADYVVTGEGEHTLPRLLRAIKAGETGPVPGVATKAGICPPDHTVFLPAYPPFSQFKGYIEISRGCPFGCAYCQTPRIFGRRMRHRPVEEIARYAARFRDARFVTPNALAYGSDDGIHPRLDRVERLFRALHKNQIYFGTFPSEVRPEFVTDESLDLISAHCANRRLHFGAQSGSDRVLGLLRRGHTVADVEHALDLCRDHGFMPVVDFIVGLPCEEDEDELATLALIREVTRRGQAHVHLFIPLPGTPMANLRPRWLLSETQRDLGRLALNGKISGSWDDPERRFYRNR